LDVGEPSGGGLATAAPSDVHKHKEHESQCEYRFAFGTRANVFDFENVQCYVLEEDFQWPRLTLNTQSHRMKLRLGSLEDCCRLLGRG
jgi:hypothetical protein